VNAIIKPATPCDPREIYIAYMFASYVRAPGRKTGPGEPVDPSRQCQQITSLLESSRIQRSRGSMSSTLSSSNRGVSRDFYGCRLLKWITSGCALGNDPEWVDDRLRRSLRCVAD